MAEILQFKTKTNTTEKRTNTGTIKKLRFEEVNDMAAKLETIAVLLRRIHDITESEIIKKGLPPENFQKVNVSELDINGFLHKEVPIEIDYAGEVNGEKYLYSAKLIVKGKNAMMHVFASRYNGKKWVSIDE